MDFFSSDTHYHHKNVIKYCSRPFVDVVEMNEAMITGHNSVVGCEDTLHFLGDFAFSDEDKHKSILARLVAKRKILYMGNHDLKWEPSQLLDFGWDEVHTTYINREFLGIRFKLCHFPYMAYDHSPDNIRYPDLRPPNEGHDWLLCGHIHEKWKVMENQINIGVDQWGFKPVSILEILDVIKQSKEQP